MGMAYIDKYCVHSVILKCDDAPLRPGQLLHCTKCKYLYINLAKWGVVEWIEHPLLMLEVRGSNPGNSISKNNTSLPPKP